MTAVDRTMAELARIAGLADAAADGPWTRSITADRAWNEIRSAKSDAENVGDERPIARSFDDDSSEFIADARTTVPRLVAALEAVLALHVEIEVWEYDDQNGVWVYDDQGEKVPLPSICRECTPHDTLLAIEGCEWTEDYESVAYPCPTVTAITRALTPEGDRA